jgi:AraC-like DNA-binding protein
VAEEQMNFQIFVSENSGLLQFHINVFSLLYRMTEIFDDINGLYAFQDPCPDLADSIEFFSETSLEASKQLLQTERFSVKLFPSYTPTMWFNLGPEYDVFDGHSLRTIGAGFDILLLRGGMVERRNLCTDHIFTIKFKPLGFERIFGYSQGILGERIFNINEVLPANVIKKVKEMPSLTQKVSFLEKILLAKKWDPKRDQYTLNKVSKAIELYENSLFTLKMNRICAELNVSGKTFNRYFHKVMGVGPRQFFSTLRARKALVAYQIDPIGFSPYDF